MFNSALTAAACAALVFSTAVQAAPAKKRAERPAKAPAPPVPVIELNAAQLDAAGRVLTGAMACEFDQHIRVLPVEGKPGHFQLVLKKTTYTLVPQETTTGAVRLEDRGAGIVWLQIPAKSMLLNTRSGQRLVDGCQHEHQRLAAGTPESALGIVAAPLENAAGPPFATAVVPPVSAQQPLIPRQVLFGPPQRSGGSISPDGQWLAWIAPHEGVPNVWVAPTSAPDAARVISDDRGRGVHSFHFARDARHLLYARDEGGDENGQIHVFDLVGGGTRPLTPKGSRAALTAISDALGGEVLISMNDRDRERMDPVRVNVATGERTRVLENDGYARILFDANFTPRYASKPRPDGGTDWFERQRNAWRPLRAGPADAARTKSNTPAVATNPHPAVLGLSADGRTLYLAESRSVDAAAIYAVDASSGARRLLLEDARVGANALMLHPTTGLAQAARRSGLAGRWVALDMAVATDLERLEALAAGGEFSVTARTRADDTWVVRIDRPESAARVYLYERSSGNSRLWYESRPAWAGLPLAPMRPINATSRDGLALPLGLSLPAGVRADAQGKPERPLPTVLLLTDGEQGTLDETNQTRQWLTNRGYAVLSVGQTAPGGSDTDAADAGNPAAAPGEQKMLADTVSWAVAGGIAQRDKVAVMGQGGTASGKTAVASVAHRPSEFACAVSFVGPGNLPGVIDAMQTSRSQATKPPDASASEQSRAPNTEASAARPVLIAQGAGPARTSASDSDTSLRAMRHHGMVPTYLLYPDEGARLVRTANIISFYALVEQFLAGCLGGRAEPVGNDLNGASVQVAAGAEQLPVLQALLPASPVR